MKWAGSLLALSVIFLSAIGLVIIFSVSSVEGERIYGDSLHFVKGQLLFFVAAISVATAIYFTPIEKWFSKGVIYILIALILIGLISVHIPGLGKEIKGSSRWIRLPGINLQTSEFVKIAAILVVAWWHGQPWRINRSFIQGAFIPICGVGVVAIGLISQPDFGSTIMLGSICIIMMLTSGVKITHLLLLATPALLGIVIAIIFDPVRIQRVLPIFQLNTSGNVAEEVLQGSLYQVSAAISAFKHGGVFGQGIGHSIYKEHYIPEYHTDFILSMVGEEFGVFGTSLCMILILVILICGLYISYKTEHFQYRLLALGMTLQISLYAIVNTGVVCGLFPTKGLAMPFLSYGGSNLFSSFMAVGFILSVAKYTYNSETPKNEPQHSTTFYNM